MSEFVIIFLCAVQLIMICCCVYVIRSYCNLPMRVARRLARDCLKEGDEETPKANDEQTSNLRSTASPQHQQIPVIYSPQPLHYPIHLMPPYPGANYPPAGYPHQVGFSLASPKVALSATNLETNLSDDVSKAKN